MPRVRQLGCVEVLRPWRSLLHTNDINAGTVVKEVVTAWWSPTVKTSTRALRRSRERSSEALLQSLTTRTCRG